MKDVRLNNGTTMTDEQFVMERGMGDTITDFVATKADLELLAQALVKRLLFDEFVLMQQVSRRDIAEREYTDFRLGRVMDYLPELRAEIEEKLRLGHIQNEADVKRQQAEWAISDVTDAETDLGDLSEI
jgi:translation elongation factor EF-Ts